MDFLKSEMLCARLTKDVWDRLTLRKTKYSEFFFKEMVEILPLPGIERWPETIQSAGDSRQQLPLLFSLVIINPHDDATTATPSQSQKLAAKAKKAALKMYVSSFESTSDHASITSAVNNFKTIGIFMCRVEKIKKGSKKGRSIFDYNNTSCLAAVTYFRHGQQTQVLWLSTTLQKPPPQSIHVVWRKQGLATYLVCLLLKQHQGREGGDNSFDDSVLCLQASMERSNPSQSFYLKLGFISHYQEDNGLSLTSRQFQKKIIKFPFAWVPPENQKMTLF